MYVGTAVGYRVEKGGDRLYRVEYSDGDVEDMDQEEYNFAYAARLMSEGWVVEEGQIEEGNPHGGPRGVSAEEDGGNDSDDEFVVDVLAREKQATSGNNTIGDVKDGVGKSVHVEGETLSVYEELRAKNVERNAKMVEELGLCGVLSSGNAKKRNQKHLMSRYGCRRERLVHFCTLDRTRVLLITRFYVLFSN